MVMILHHAGNLCGKLVENTLMFCEIPIRILKTTISRPGTRLTSNSHLRKMEIGRKIDFTRKYHFQHDRLANLRFNEPTPFSKIPEYRSFLKRIYFPEPKEKSGKQEEKLCYASGERKEDVETLSLSERYSLNKMFVDTTQNYAARFDKKNINHNYQ